MSLVGEYGLGWPRNDKNLKKLKTFLKKKKGIYVLSHGAMPMYVGKGKISSRVGRHAKPRSSKSKFWDHFSWFVIDRAGFESELEVILLRTLPFYVRSLNRQTGTLGRRNRVEPDDMQPVPVELPNLPQKQKKKKKA